MNIFFMNFKRNMKAAFKTLKANFKEYICFIIALTMVQMLFCVLTIAVFNDREQKVWSVHLPVAPDGYAPDEKEYKTLDTFSDVNIFLEKAA